MLTLVSWLTVGIGTACLVQSGIYFWQQKKTVQPNTVAL
jgi:hypothetical protein